jgi:hypothetical protein
MPPTPAGVHGRVWWRRPQALRRLAQLIPGPTQQAQVPHARARGGGAKRGRDRARQRLPYPDRR